MEENDKFVFTQKVQKVNPKSEIDFRKERAAYLAQRNARKKQAELVIKMECGHSSSSDEDCPRPQKGNQMVKFEQNQEGSNANANKNSRYNEKEDPQNERQRYMAERAAHRRQYAKNKEVEFGCTSSDDEEKKVPVFKSELTIPPRLEYKRRSLREDKEITQEEEMSKSQNLKQNNLHLSARLKVDPTEKKLHRQRYEIQIPSKKGVNIWLEMFLQFKQHSIEIAERVLPIYDITKTKLFFIRTQSGSYKMKITYKDEDIFLAVNHKKINELCLDHYYYIFAKVVTLKLQLMGKTFCEKQRSKLGLSEKQLNGAQISGRVRKTSFFGGWEQTVGVVNQSGLCIFKQNKDKPLMVISYNSIRELWTRFDFDGDNLIVKFLHNSSKVQLSIPFENFLSRDNWLYHIYNLACK